jgi:glucosamine--fructose-6-phosphate aminotransferase (isomerizing)
MTAEPSFDPSAPLAGPPDPWAFAPAPLLRDGPPYHMTEMIAAEPAVTRRIIAGVTASGAAGALADAIRAAVSDGTPVVVTGCGTSETAATGVAAILREALVAAGSPDAPVTAEQALELALDPPTGGLVVGVSHEGGTGATNAALRAARDAGAQTAVITVDRRSPAGALADIVLETAELDHSWCHTIGYTSPLAVAAATAAALTGQDPAGDRLAGLLAAGAMEAAAAEAIASQLATTAHLLVVASGADRAAGREMMLKVEEASWLPSAYRDLETLLHGHLPATGRETGLVVMLVGRAHRAERMARAQQALAAARVIGIRSAAILAAELDSELDAELTPAGRILVPDDPEVPAAIAALFGSAGALQLLTERLARARGTNPDLIRRDDPTYRRAANAAGG